MCETYHTRSENSYEQLVGAPATMPFPHNQALG